MPPFTPAPQPGLGASIVEALARQLRAEVKVSALSPGAQISIEHRTSSSGNTPNDQIDPVAVA